MGGFNSDVCSGLTSNRFKYCWLSGLCNRRDCGEYWFNISRMDILFVFIQVTPLVLPPFRFMDPLIFRLRLLRFLV
jgi:hypothetical protein